MQKPAKPRVDVVEEIKGLTSLELSERCPDQLTVFPSSPCTNVDCEWSIKCSEYMNCSFVASEAGEHPLQLIGDWLGISREGVRLIQKKALLKLRQTGAFEQANHGPVLQPLYLAGPHSVGSSDEGPELEHEAHLVSALHGGELD